MFALLPTYNYRLCRQFAEQGAISSMLTSERQSLHSVGDETSRETTRLQASLTLGYLAQVSTSIRISLFLQKKRSPYLN